MLTGIKSLHLSLLLLLVVNPFLRAQQPVPGTRTVEFEIHASDKGKIIPNVADNINVWNYHEGWLGPKDKEYAGHFSKNMPFVTYVQFMMAAGGNAGRDLFENPLDRSVTDDYDFTPLIEACRNVIAQGLIPHLKIGNVPLKYTANPKISQSFGVNLLPPDSYETWYLYVQAMGEALVRKFGRKNVQAWRFGVLTEYENKDWFSVDDDPEATRTAYFKLYDYTVDALQRSIGKNICVGGHSMTVSEGLWDERDFITHCARGKNFRTGKKGTRLCYLSSSYYDPLPGKTAGKTLPECIALLRKHAEKEGFKNLIYGIDEGRILQGTDKKDLDPRAIGNTWQAAYDARIFKTLVDHDIDYFSQWKFTSGGLWEGIPSVSLHTANLFYILSGNKRLGVDNTTTRITPGDTDAANTGCIAAIDERKNKLLLLFYAYSDSVYEQGMRSISCRINDLSRNVRNIKAVRTLISDDSNFFDEWERDQKEEGITGNDFGWSKSSFVTTVPTLKNKKHIDYVKSREAFYAQCAALKQEAPFFIPVKNGQSVFTCVIPVHGVALYEMKYEP